MRHGAARHRLPQLFDDILSPATERDVRAHAHECVRCRRELADFELCDTLVARLPLAVLPLAQPAAGERRLERLARWTLPRPAARARGRWRALEGVAAAAAAGLFAGMVAFAGAARWVPVPAPTPSSLTQVAYVTAGVAQN